jgi:hypothetical protein
MMIFDKTLSTRENEFCRFMYGDTTTEHVTPEEMHALEKNLEVWMYKVRSVKVI